MTLNRPMYGSKKRTVMIYEGFVWGILVGHRH